MMPPTPLSRCALYCALALAATPALADTVTLTELPAPDGYPVAGVSNIAADGTVIGTVFPDGLVVRWTPGAAPEVLGGGMTYTLENIMPLISKDASVIATAGYFGDDPLHAAPEIWQGGTDWAMVSGLTLGDSTPFGISWSGQVLSGAAYPADPPADGPSPVLPWIWTAAGGQVALALPADAFSGQAWAVSDDGSVAAGFAEPSPDDWTRYGMRWVDGAPQWILDADSQRVGQAIACNGDCSVIVGAGVGPNSPHAWRWTVDGGVEYFIARTGYTGEDGFEIALPAAHAEALWRALAGNGVKPCGLGARDTLRLEAGMNLYGQDMSEDVTPLESGLAWTVDMKSPRDFVGKAALAANPPRAALVGLRLEDGGGVLRAHQRVQTPAGDGEITSGTFSPTLQKSIALARVPHGVAVGDRVEVEVRDKLLAARVVKPPFVRNGRALV